jgi:hypothetical protein
MIKTISLRLDIEQYQRLRVMSFVNEKPISEMIREAIDEYIKEHKAPKPGQEWFWAEAWQKAERDVEADLAAGSYETFDTLEDFLKGLK